MLTFLPTICRGSSTAILYQPSASMWDEVERISNVDMSSDHVSR